jgi:hypothetical protein
MMIVEENSATDVLIVSGTKTQGGMRTENKKRREEEKA